MASFTCSSESSPQALVNALMRADPEHGRRLRDLFQRGEACAFEAQGPAGAVAVEGRAGGAVAWLRLSAVLGEAPGPRVRQRIGYLPEERGLYDRMTVIDELRFFAELRGVASAEAEKRIGDWL